jgi:hypothetical protein
MIEPSLRLRQHAMNIAIACSGVGYLYSHEHDDDGGITLRFHRGGGDNISRITIHEPMDAETGHGSCLTGGGAELRKDLKAVLTSMSFNVAC